MNRLKGGILLWERARVEIDGAGFYAGRLYERLGGRICAGWENLPSGTNLRGSVRPSIMREDG